ncbi:6898_t:CDS:10 [Diversispora eburnea]|uniref:6898_t:CDS:1 n=1 Tax=Diversispora eburnea TaxID=1213867 RepID=A0A9N8YNI7_9GLOM|nr:6898_t:CDS:10 [Diversispora eburnea]
MQAIYDRVPKHECIDERKTPTSSGHSYVDRNNNMTHEHITQTTERVYEKTEIDIMQINDTNDIPENSRSNATKSLSNLEWNNNNEENDKTSQDADILCPICLDIIKEAFIGRCDCPTCGTHLMRDQIYPNFILNRILEKSPSIISYQNDSIPSSPAKQLKTKLLKDDLSIEEIKCLEEDYAAIQQEIDNRIQRQKNIKNQEKLRIRQLSFDLEPMEINSISEEVQQKDQQQQQKGDQDQIRKRKHTEVDDLTEDIVTLLDRIEVPHEPNLQNKKQRGLSRFSTTLKTFTRYSNFRLVNTLRYGDIFNTSSIVSTIEFDRDNEYFATAGVTKKIKIFEYGNIERNKYGDAFGRHLSSNEMACRSKISCLSWNNYIKSQIVSADYEGIVSLWDANTGSQVLEFNEHEKRAWSVDFGRMDPTKLASGSDDAKVFTLESNANVCCVKFNPEICHHLAFGSHPKAVSYVKFLRRNELISASTDSTLKLWDIDTQTCARTYTGHINEKNFVGLSTSSDWIACGSEDNSVFAYYKALSKPVAKFRFGNINPVTGEEIMDADPSLFVSSVCWKNDSNTLLAANSQGTIKVLELE